MMYFGRVSNIPLSTFIYSGLPLEYLHYLISTYFACKIRPNLVDTILDHSAVQVLLSMRLISLFTMAQH